MAYIPKDDDEQQSGMNILDPQNQQNQQQQEAQNESPSVSGGQSATIGSGQAQQGSQGQSQAPKGQQKKAKSGMFTNIRKYIDQNKPGAQNMSGRLQQNVSQQNQGIQQAIQKQQSDFMSRVNQNRQRMQEAQQFGQQTLQSAQTQESMPMLQQQQQDLQQRVGQFGNVSDQSQNISQYTGQVNTQQGVYDQAQQAYQDQLSRAQEQQRLFQNKTQLQGELSDLEARIQNAPESLTEDDITRFNQLRTGIERFDDAILNLSEQRRGVQDLTAQAETLGTSQGRRDLMRQEFGRQGGYTSGQAALDNLILTGDQNAMRELVQNSQLQAEQAQQALEQAFREGRVTQDEMARGTRQIQRDLQTGVEQAQTALQEGLANRARTGEGTFIRELQEKLASGQGLSREDMETLGITGQERFNTDPNQLLRNLQINPDDFSIQDVANLTDVARADALARLSGEEVGENRFVTEQLGIGDIDRQQIEARNLRADPAEEFTRTREELAPQDRAMVDDFLNKLGNAQYQSVDQARGDIYKSVANYHNGNEIANVAPMIQSLVENGQTGWEGGTVDLNKILAGDLDEAAKLTHTNYWAWAGQGRHGVATPPAVMMNAVRQAHAQTQALKSAYGATNQNALRSEAQSAYVGQQPVDRIRRA